MPIRTKPFGTISAADVRTLIDRGIREDRTIDFKETLKLDDSGKLDLLQDVTAMANASGGIIIYGAIEGEGDDRGRIVEVRGITLAPDQTDLQISNLLRDNIDERINGVEHRALPLGASTYLYVIRVPASPRAPHMITLRSHRPRFYLRATTSNDPMNAQQIREVAMRAESAYDRARQRIADRVSAIDVYARERAARAKQVLQREVGTDFVVLHFLPLFPPRGGVDLSSRELYVRWHQVKPLGADSAHNVRLGFEGIAAEYDDSDAGAGHWTMLLREGGLEFVEASNAWTWHEGMSATLDLQQLEDNVLEAIEEARRLADEGYLTLPFALSLQLHNLRGLQAGSRAMRLGMKTVTIAAAPIAPIEVNRWEDVPNAVRGIFHVMWQAMGYQRSLSYDESGERRRPR